MQRRAAPRKSAAVAARSVRFTIEQRLRRDLIRPEKLRWRRNPSRSLVPKRPSAQAVLVVAQKATVGELQGAVAALFRNKKVLPVSGTEVLRGRRSGLDLFITADYQPEIDVQFEA